MFSLQEIFFRGETVVERRWALRGKKEDTIEQTEIILFDVTGLRIKFKGNTFSYHKMCYYALSGNGLKSLHTQPKCLLWIYILLLGRHGLLREV